VWAPGLSRCPPGVRGALVLAGDIRSWRGEFDPPLAYPRDTIGANVAVVTQHHGAVSLM
jgi:hypothetical protein